MYYGGYNDYELLYLAKELNEEAIMIIYQKYDSLIMKKAHIYQNSLNFDDLCQEGKMVLNKAIQKFNEIYNKTFTKYFELLIERRFIDIYRKNKRDIINLQIDNELVDYYQQNSEEKVDSLILSEMININYQNLSTFEQKVFDYKYIENKKVSEISQILDTKAANISNAIQRIKKKKQKRFLR